jgi:hypothetical protein
VANYWAAVRAIERGNKIGTSNRICSGVIEARKIIAKGCEMKVALWYKRDLGNRVIVHATNASVESTIERLGKEHRVSRNYDRISRASKARGKWAGNYDPETCKAVTL